MEQGIVAFAARCRRWMLGIALMTASISLLAACGDSQEPQEQETFKRPLKWWVVESKGPRLVTVRGSAGHCEGLPEPRVLEVVKRYRGSNVFVRIVIDEPADAPENQEILCRGVGYPIKESIFLPRPLKELVLFDSGVDPPAQRWPEASSK